MQLKDINLSDEVLTELIKASEETLGGVKINGNGLTIDDDGVLSVTVQGGTEYSSGDGIDIQGNVISVKIGDNMFFEDGCINTHDEYELLTAGVDTLGGIKTGWFPFGNGNYGLSVTSEGYAYVNVPWKDMVVQSAWYVPQTKDIVIKFNSESKDQISVNVSDLVDTYTAGTGLTAYENEFSLKTATDSEIGGVKINGNNLAIALDGTLSAKSGLTSESDPVFTNWVYGESIIAGSKFTKLGDYNDIVSIGKSIQTSGDNNVTIGFQIVNEGKNNVAIGNNISTRFKNSQRIITIGYNTTTYDDYAIAIGNSSEASKYAIGIGDHACASYESSIAIGDVALASAEKAIQLGQGENNLSSTFQVFNYKMMDENGNIPRERMGNVLSTVSEYDWQTLSASADPQIIYFIY